MSWDRPVPSVLRYQPADPNPTAKVAAFDLDWTLIRPMRYLISTDTTNLVLMPRVRETLSYLREQGYTIVVFTNQRCKSEKECLTKMQRVVAALHLMEVPVYALMALAEDEYRKPQPGMWDLLPFTADKTQSFYVGDAAGRPGDFAASDRLFAEYVGIAFSTPEDFFPKVTLPIHPNQHLVLLMGMPGVGKTTLYQQTYAPLGYVHVNQDTSKTREKVLRELRRVLATGQNIVIDSTNPNREKRAEYLQLARASGYTTDIVFLTRSGEEYNKLRPEPVPRIAYSMYFKQLELPTAQEVTGAVYEL